MPVEWILLPDDVWGAIALRKGCFLPLCRTKEIPFRREEVASLLLQREWRNLVAERILPPQKGDRVALLLPKRRLLTGTVEMFGSEEDEERMVYFACSDGRKVLFWKEGGKEKGGVRLIRLGPHRSGFGLESQNSGFKTWRTLSSFLIEEEGGRSHS